jgi:hypothetical protein
MNRCYETIALRRNRLDELWGIGIIIQRPPDLAHGGVDAAISVDEDAFTPDSLNDFLTGNNLPAAFHEKTKKFERDAFEMDYTAIASELVGAPVQFEILESVYFLRHSTLSIFAVFAIAADLTTREADSQTLQKTFSRSQLFGFWVYARV